MFKRWLKKWLFNNELSELREILREVLETQKKNKDLAVKMDKIELYYQDILQRINNGYKNHDFGELTKRLEKQVKKMEKQLNYVLYVLRKEEKNAEEKTKLG